MIFFNRRIHHTFLRNADTSSTKISAKSFSHFPPLLRCGHRFSLFLLSNFPPMPWRRRSRVAPNGTKSCSLCVEEDKSIQSNSGRNLLWNISLPAAFFDEVRLPAMVTPNSSGMVRAPRKSIIITFRYCLPRDQGKIHRSRIPNIYRHLCYGQLK